MPLQPISAKGGEYKDDGKMMNRLVYSIIRCYRVSKPYEGEMTTGGVIVESTIIIHEKP